MDFGGLELRSTSIGGSRMYNFAQEKQWFAMADAGRQFGTLGQWFCYGNWGPAVWDFRGLVLDSLPLEQLKCVVLHMKSNGFAMAMSSGNLGLRGSGT